MQSHDILGYSFLWLANVFHQCFLLQLISSTQTEKLTNFSSSLMKVFQRGLLTQRSFLTFLPPLLNLNFCCVLGKWWFGISSCITLCVHVPFTQRKRSSTVNWEWFPVLGMHYMIIWFISYMFSFNNIKIHVRCYTCCHFYHLLIWLVVEKSDLCKIIILHYIFILVLPIFSIIKIICHINRWQKWWRNRPFSETYYPSLENHGTWPLPQGPCTR